MNLENWQLETSATLFFCVFMPIFLYFSYWLFITGIIGLYRMNRSKKWKFTVGKIINADINYKDFNTDRETSTKLTIVKEYTYTVNDKEYKSNQTYASDSLFAKDLKRYNKPEKYANDMHFINSEKEMKNLIGTSARVYYDPKKPHLACLVPQVNNEIFLPIFMGLLASSGISYIAFYFVRPLFQ
jgi:hypothetical protein